jgi:hypothetical protein
LRVDANLDRKVDAPAKREVILSVPLRQIASHLLTGTRIFRNLVAVGRITVSSLRESYGGTVCGDAINNKILNCAKSSAWIVVKSGHVMSYITLHGVMGSHHDFPLFLN